MSIRFSKTISSTSEIFLHKDYSLRETALWNKAFTATSTSGSDQDKNGSVESGMEEVVQEFIATEGSLDAEDESVESVYEEQRGILCVLEDTVDQLEVLGRILPHSFDKYEGYLTLEERYAEPERTMISDEVHTGVEDSLMRIQSVRSFVEAVLVRTVMEMETTGTFEPLQEAIQDVQKMKDDDKFLLKEMAENKREVERLRAELQALVEEQRVAVEQAEWGIVNLKELTHATVVEMSIQRRYVTRWEECRDEQRELICQMEELRLRDTTRQLYVDMDSENRVNQEIETHINMTKQELEDSIERWMELYDKESEDRDKAILKLKMEREVHMRIYLELKDKFQAHRDEMDNWLQVKEKRRLKAEHEAMLNRMATRIQAWWRGTMYRRKLGPYRKKKKKGKGAGKKGKGAGKKGKGK